MVKQKKRIFAFSVILIIIFLSTINGAISVAASTSSPSSAGETQKQGDGLTFNIKKGYTIPQNGYPVQYGVIIPDTNMWTSYEVQASNQGIFKIQDWDGYEEEELSINNPGEDISLISPWSFDYILNSLTDNDYIDPWDVKWLQANASSAESDTLDPYTVNSVWNYYTMTESSVLSVPIRDLNPIQVDMIIRSTGPKVLKCNKIRDYDSEVDNLVIVSPSGELIQRASFPAMLDDTLFFYYIFIAHEVGTYRLLLREDDYPEDLEIEFLDFDLKTLPFNKLTYGGTCDETPSMLDMEENEWSIEWWKFSGNKGDKFTLEFKEDFSYDDITYAILWHPTCTGYEFYPNSVLTLDASKEIYLPTTGNFYISVLHLETLSFVRYSLLLKPITVIDYTIGDDLTTIDISKNERKAIEFEVLQDSFVRFNFTTTGFGTINQPLSDTEIIDPIYEQEYWFIFEDAKKISCWENITYIDTKTVSGEILYYYYMPAGTYEAIIRNIEDDEDGIFQISSKFIEWATDDIPVNTLTYPQVEPSQFESFEFQPDEYEPSLKQAQAITFDITSPGQFFLNTTMLASKNLAATSPATGSPSHLYTYNTTDDNFYNSAYPIPAFSTDGDSTTADFPPDIFFIGAPLKWTGALINLTTNGTVGQMGTSIWTGTSWIWLDNTDGTNHLYHNGTIEADTSDYSFQNWVKGVPQGYGFDIPMVNEDEYYWWLLFCQFDYDVIPIIANITLLNMTKSGDVNMVLLRDSGYEHCDVWWPDDMVQPAQIDNLIITRDEDLLYDTRESEIIKYGDPWTIGLETGTYTLLVIPENWEYDGNINLDFAVVDYGGYVVSDSYTISHQPLAYPWNITSGIINSDLHLYNYTTYPYDLENTFNNTEVEILDGEGYFVLECYGSAYNWTQLVIAHQNVSDVDIYLMQDLPWVNNGGPNNEVVNLIMDLASNSTIEFGVLSDHFTLIFEYADDGDEMITFRIGLSQYNTGQLTTTAPVASGLLISGDGDDDDDEEVTPPIPTWVPIGIVAAIGAGIAGILLFLKKKGRIGEKTP